MILRFDFDTWKLPTVESHMRAAGYEITMTVTTGDTTKILVEAPSIRAGNDTFSAAMRECATGQP